MPFALAVELGPWAAIPIFAAGTGLRPEEWIARSGLTSTSTDARSRSRAPTRRADCRCTARATRAGAASRFNEISRTSVGSLAKSS